MARRQAATLHRDLGGETLRIGYICDSFSCSIGYRIRLPENVEVQAKTSSGDVTITGITARVSVGTDSGDVTLTRVKGKVTVKTTSGRVSTSELAAAQTAVATTSGEVDLKYSVAPQALSLRSTSGDTRVVVPADREPYLVRVRTTSGDQRVTVDQSQSADRTIEAETTSGDVTIGYA